jgi:hypothetical protein
VRRASFVALPLLAICAAPAAPAGAAARVTAQDRGFARAAERWDAAVGQAFKDPAALAAVRERQQAATACLDVAQSLGASQDGGAQLATIVVYDLYALQPVAADLVAPTQRYVRSLRHLHLHAGALRSARSVVIHEWGHIGHAAGAILSDFCTPLRAWQAAGYSEKGLPPEMDRTLDAANESGNQEPGDEAKLKRAAKRLRAAGMSRAVRARFVSSGPDTGDTLLKDDPVLAALTGS